MESPGGGWGGHAGVGSPHLSACGFCSLRTVPSSLFHEAASSQGEGAGSAVPRPLPGSRPAGASVSPGGRWTHHSAITSMSMSLSCRWPLSWGHKVLHSQLMVTSLAATPWPECPEPPQETPVPRSWPRFLLGPHPNSFLCPAVPFPRAPASSHARDHTGKGHAGGREGLPLCPTVSGELGGVAP